MTPQPRGALEAIAERKDELIGFLRDNAHECRAEDHNAGMNADYPFADALDALADRIPALLSAKSEGDDNNLPEPFPRVHSYDPSGARRTVTVQWGGESFVSYVRYGDRSTWKEIPPINETPVEHPAPSAGVGQTPASAARESEAARELDEAKLSPAAVAMEDAICFQWLTDDLPAGAERDAQRRIIASMPVRSYAGVKQDISAVWSELSEARKRDNSQHAMLAAQGGSDG